jgi:microcompartment protein CcmL/EutN
MTSAYEAVALVEIASIARGFVTLDALMKRAQVSVKAARPVTPGKYVILFGGDVAAVTESLEAARETAGAQLIDELLLPYAHRRLLPAVDGELSPEEGESVGIVEMTTVAATVQAADVALKATDVAVLRMHLAIGVGGKGWFTLAGALADVEAALDAVRDDARPERIVGIELIPQPHGEVRGYFT